MSVINMNADRGSNGADDPVVRILPRAPDCRRAGGAGAVRIAEHTERQWSAHASGNERIAHGCQSLHGPDATPRIPACGRQPGPGSHAGAEHGSTEEPPRDGEFRRAERQHESGVEQEEASERGEGRGWDAWAASQRGRKEATYAEDAKEGQDESTIGGHWCEVMDPGGWVFAGLRLRNVCCFICMMAGRRAGSGLLSFSGLGKVIATDFYPDASRRFGWGGTEEHVRVGIYIFLWFCWCLLFVQYPWCSGDHCAFLPKGERGDCGRGRESMYSLHGWRSL